MVSLELDLLLKQWRAPFAKLDVAVPYAPVCTGHRSDTEEATSRIRSGSVGITTDESAIIKEGAQSNSTESNQGGGQQMITL